MNKTPDESPFISINHENYDKNLISGHGLGFQTKEWYDTNKNNFCNSLRDNFSELLPSFVHLTTPLPDNYLGFYPDEFIRYGYLEKITLRINNNSVNFWAVKIPKGLQVYHTSRSLGLNHSDYPIRGYDDNYSNEENKERILNQCKPSDFIGHEISDVINGQICTYVSYYSTPASTEEYLHKTGGFGEQQIEYTYGILNSSDEKYNKNYNDRLQIQSDIHKYGAQAYVLSKDTYFIILGLDDYLIERPDLGRDNMKKFKNIMINLRGKIQNDMKISTGAMDNFLNIIDSVTGIGTLQDNVNALLKDYGGNSRYFSEWIQKNASVYLNPNTRSNTAGYIKEVANKSKSSNLDSYKGLRYSTIEHDKPVMNMLGWLFKGDYPAYNSLNQPISVYGFISSSMYVIGKGGRSGIRPTPITRNNLQYYKAGMFHSEIGLFFAPDVLERDRTNKHDLEYSINYEGITQEMRKYKTSNIMHYKDGFVDGFHQGHLMEHSTWVGILSSYYSKENMFLKYTSKIDHDVYLIAGYFHDIGKSGECKKHAVYNGFDMTDPRLSICKYVKEDGKIIGMKYFDIPEHPEKGYKYLKGYKTYRKYSLLGLDSIESYENNSIPTYNVDWDRMFDHLEVNKYNRKLVRMAAGCHWYFGNALKNISNGEDQENAVDEFIRKIELFYTDEFLKLNTDEFFSVILFIIIISYADIMGSEYDPNLKSQKLTTDEIPTLINYLPNTIPETDENDDNIIEETINYALELSKNSEFKADIIKNVTLNTQDFIEYVQSKMENYQFNQFNNYSILYNLINSYENVDDIKTAYGSKFPKVITFDLDQTMFSVRFVNNGLSEYYIYPATYKIMEEVQKLRKKYFPDNPTYIAITSRHYSPISLYNLIRSPIINDLPNPLYYENFDYIVSRYTGPFSRIERDVSGVDNFFDINGYPGDGFILDTDPVDFKYIRDDNTEFPDLDKISKHGHFSMIKNRYNIEYKDILSYDDDDKYFTEKGLGPAKDVTVAGVLNSRKTKDQGIRFSLFRSAIAYYVFSKMK